MWRSGYLGVLALGALLFTTTLVNAGESDWQRLDWNKSCILSSNDQFLLEGRAKPIDDDLQDVNLRYWLGYNRGINGGIYILPRFYAFRAGFWDGYYGNAPNSAPYFIYWPSVRSAYYGGWIPIYPGTIRSGYGYSGATPYGSAPTYSGSPALASLDGFPGTAPFASNSMPANAATLPAAPPRNLAGATGPNYRAPANPRAGEPAPVSRKQAKPVTGQEGAYPYDGPPRKLMPPVDPPTYHYDGGPSNPVPMPGVVPNSPNSKFDPADGRVVSLPSSKKASYPAYGEQKKAKVEDGLRTVKGN